MAHLKEPTKLIPVTVRIPETLANALRHKAAASGISFQQLVSDALRKAGIKATREPAKRLPPGPRPTA